MRRRTWMLLVMSLFLAYPLFADEEPDTSKWDEGEEIYRLSPFS